MTALIDCDVHFTDHDEDAWNVGPVPAASRPKIIASETGSQRLAIGELLFPRPEGPGKGNPNGIGHLVAPGLSGDRQRHGSVCGVVTTVLQPGFVGLSIHAVADADTRRALLARYNGLVAEEAARDETARWALLTTLEDLSSLPAALEEFKNDAQLVGVVVRPTGRLSQHRWSSDAALSALELLARNRLTLFLHGGTGCYQWSPLADGFESYEMTHALGHMGEHMIAVSDLIGVRAHLPVDLRVILLESGTAWLPSVLDRLDSHKRRIGNSSRSVWDVFREHFAVVPDVTENDIASTCARIGAESILFGSDYPHWDCIDAVTFFEQLAPGIDRSSVARASARFIPRCAQMEEALR